MPSSCSKSSSCQPSITCPMIKPMLLPPSVCRDVWADAAYHSQSIEAQLKRQQLRARIHHKGYRNTPVTAQQRARTRARVEHVFAITSWPWAARSCARLVSYERERNEGYGISPRISTGFFDWHAQLIRNR